MPSARATEVRKRFGKYVDIAQREPVTITRHDRETVVMVSAARFRELERALSASLFAHEVPDDLAREIRKAEYSE